VPNDLDDPLQSDIRLHVLTFDKAYIVQTLSECHHMMALSDVLRRDRLPAYLNLTTDTPVLTPLRLG
jgi:hypothetical protein